MACLLGFRGCLQVGTLEALCVDYRLWQVVGGRFIARAKNAKKEQVKNQSKSNKKSFSSKRHHCYGTSTSNVASGDTKEPLRKGEKTCWAPGGRGYRGPGPWDREKVGPRGAQGDQGSKSKSRPCFSAHISRKRGGSLWLAVDFRRGLIRGHAQRVDQILCALSAEQAS